MTGDFFQLPPVVKGGKVSFAFEAEKWNSAIKGNMFKLTKVFRQRDQGSCTSVRFRLGLTPCAEFVDMLNEMRYGELSQKSIQRFKSLDREIIYEDGVSAAELFVDTYSFERIR